MSNYLQYKGYAGTIEFSEEDQIFFGKVMGVRASITYEGETAKDLLSDFQGAIDDYLAICEAEDITPEKAFKGSFNVRISPELHRDAVFAAKERNMNLNSFVEASIAKAVYGNKM